MSVVDVTMWTYRADIMDPGDISGYSIHAIDGDIGKVDKHDGEAGRSYLLVATGPWIFGKTVMLPAGVIDRIDHENKTVYVGRTPRTRSRMPRSTRTTAVRPAATTPTATSSAATTPVPGSEFTQRSLQRCSEPGDQTLPGAFRS